MESTSTNWLPESEDERIHLGFKVIQDAYRSKVQGLENDVRALRAATEEYKQALSALQKKSGITERELVEAHQRNFQMQEENKTLAASNRALHRQLEKQRKMQQTLAEALESAAQDDDSPTGYDNTGSPDTSFTSRLTQPPPTRGYFPAPVAPAAPSVAASRQSPPLDTNSGVDGKTFFRTARSRLSYEGFNSFLGAIKRLNSHQSSKEDVVLEAKKIFGTENGDLMADFLQLINRHA